MDMTALDKVSNQRKKEDHEYSRYIFFLGGKRRVAGWV